jgi:hypothetical protein
MNERILALSVFALLVTGCTAIDSSPLSLTERGWDIGSVATPGTTEKAEAPSYTTSPTASPTTRPSSAIGSSRASSLSTSVNVDWKQVPSPAPVEMCKVEDGQPDFLKGKERGTVVNGQKARYSVGFPFSEGNIPIRGEANILGLMVSFTDTVKYEFVESPSEWLQPQVDKIEEWGDFWSQNTFKYKFHVVDSWVRLPISSDQVPRDQKTLVEMIKKNIPENIDWSNIDATFIYWSPGVEKTRGEKALRVGSNEHSFHEGEERPVLFWAPGNWHYESGNGLDYSIKKDYTWSYWIHELLHEQGLNLHAPGNGWPLGLGQNQYPRPVEYSSAIPAWEQWTIGWNKDSQVHCILPDSLQAENIILTPLEVYGGERRLIVLPFDNKDVLVIESRRQMRENVWNSDESGLIVYTVNPSAGELDDHSQGDCGNDRKHQKWAYLLFPDHERVQDSHCGAWNVAMLNQGEVLTYRGVQITLPRSDRDLDYVTVKKVG